MYDQERNAKLPSSSYGSAIAAASQPGPLRSSKLREMAILCSDRMSQLHGQFSELEMHISNVLKPVPPTTDSEEKAARDRDAQSDLAEILERTLLSMESLESRFKSTMARSEA